MMWSGTFIFFIRFFVFDIFFFFNDTATTEIYTLSLHDALPICTSFRLHLPGNELQITLPLPGVHNVRNACAAAAVGLALELTAAQIKRGLESVAPVDGRLRPIPGIGGSRLFDDSYNSNPASAIAAAEFLATQEGASILVLADMLELGEEIGRAHV